MISDGEREGDEELLVVLFSYFDAADLARNGLGHLADELDDAGIFVGCGGAFDVVLELLFELV